MINGAYDKGRAAYWLYGFDPSKSPYLTGSSDNENFILGMSQAYRLYPAVEEREECKRRNAEFVAERRLAGMKAEAERLESKATVALDCKKRAYLKARDGE